MMKKFILIIMTSCFLLSGTFIFTTSTASGATSTFPTSQTAAAGKIAASQQNRLPSAKVWAAETKTGLQKMNSNREQIKELQQKSNTAYKAAKNRVNQLMKNKDSLTDDQLEALKQAAATLTQDRKQLQDTTGDIQKESQKLKTARINRNLKTYKKVLENIIEIQRTRIGMLKTVIADMKKISAM